MRRRCAAGSTGIGLKASAANQTFYAHYVLTESQTNPADDPLVLWQQGGPGSSGFGYGWLAELGPYNLDAESLTKNTSAVPLVFAREYSWDANANLVLFEHPPGTGFSYCVDASDQLVDCQWNDQTQALAFYQTLSAFYKAFPSYASSDLHLIGESYAGLLLPFLTAEIYRHPDETAAKQLRGVAIGNGCPGTSGATPSNRGSCNGPYGTFDQQHVLELVAGHLGAAAGAVGRSSIGVRVSLRGADVERTLRRPVVVQVPNAHQRGERGGRALQHL